MDIDLSGPDLEKAIATFWKENPSPNPLSKLGFFSAPVLAEEGPLDGLVLKKYPGRRNRDEVETLIAHHEQYVEDLQSLGVQVPQTTMTAVKDGKWVHPVVLQEAFQAKELARHQMEHASDLGEYLPYLEALLLHTLEFIDKRKEANLTIGFHPTTRNYAVRDERWYYFDTFPPMSMDQQALNGLMRSYLPLPPVARRSISASWLDRVTSEYYNDCMMVTGIVGSACRLRPDETNEILSFCHDLFLGKIHDTALRSQVLVAIKEPPRLSRLWVFLRKFLQKEGAPNIHKNL